MKNLKRILSLALAGTMLVGMMVVGASAAEITDRDEINPDRMEAVEILYALGVVDGNGGTNKFNPKGTLKRSEMVKIVATIHSAKNGISPKDIFGTDTETPFADVPAGKWYVPFVAYGYGNGLIRGTGTSFHPDEKLTGTDAARMILNLMGYAQEEVAGVDWKTATNLQAAQANLFKGMPGVVINQPISRENMAQMVQNALIAPMNKADVTVTTRYELKVKATKQYIDTFDTRSEAYLYLNLMGEKLEDYTITPVDDASAETLGQHFMNLEMPHGVLSNIEYKSNKYVTTINGTPYTLTTDYSEFIGHDVTVLKKNGEPCGVFSNSTVVYTGIYGDIGEYDGDDKTLELGGIAYDSAVNGSAVYTWNNTGVKNETPNKVDILTAIDQTGKDGIDILIVKTVEVNTVKSVDDKGGVVITGLNDGEDAKALDPAKNNLPEGLKKDDWVAYTKDVKNAVTAEKIDVIESVRLTKVTGTKAPYTYTIGGKTYKDSASKMSGAEASAKLYDMVAYEGYIFSFELHKDGEEKDPVDLSKVVLITEVAKQPTVPSSDKEEDEDDYEFDSDTPKDEETEDLKAGAELNVKVRVWADNEAGYETLVVSTVDGEPAGIYEKEGSVGDKTEGNYETAGKNSGRILSALVSGDNNLYVIAKTDKKTGAVELVSLAADAEASEGALLGLTDASDTALADEEGVTAIADGKLGGKVRFTNNTVFYVTYEDSVEEETVTVYEKLTGAQLAAKWNGLKIDSKEIYTEASEDGFPYAVLAFLSLSASPNPVVSDDLFGYITADVYTEYLEEGEEGATAANTYYRIKIWDGENETDYLLAAADKDGEPINEEMAGTEKGTMVTFKVDEGKVLKSIDELTVADAVGEKAVVAAAITALSSTEFVIKAYESRKDGKNAPQAGDDIASGALSKITSIIYIDDSKQAAAKTGALKKATTGVNNVYVYSQGTNLVLFVDVDNKVEQGQPTYTITITADPENLSEEGGHGAYSVTVAPADAEAEAIEIGAKFTVTVTCTKLNEANAENGETVTVKYGTATEQTGTVTKTEMEKEENEGKVVLTFTFTAQADKKIVEVSAAATPAKK